MKRFIYVSGFPERLRRCWRVREFLIRLSTVAEIKAFVCVATVHPFEVYVSTRWQTVSAKSFMGMFSLDFSGPLRVEMECSEAEYARFHHQAAAFLAPT